MINKIQYGVVRLLAILAGVISLIIYEDYNLHIGASILLFFFMVFRAIGIQSKKRFKFFLIVLYCVSLVIQIYFFNVVLSNEIKEIHELIFGDINFTYLKNIFNRAFAVCILFLPIYIEKNFTVKNDKEFYMPSIEDLNAMSFGELKRKLEMVDSKVKGLGNVKSRITYGNIKEIVKDLPRHGYTKYVNEGSLTKEYFDEAYRNLNDPYIYIVISNTGSPASDVISVFTKKQYNHASLAFDYDLKTIVSYNGGENIYPPGLNSEMIEYFNKTEESSVIVYRIAVSNDVKRELIDRVKCINDEGSAYNILGLVTKRSYKPNMMFCSQFVYKMLKYAEIDIFEKNENEIKPTDFVELDYYRKMEYCYEIKFH